MILLGVLVGTPVAMLSVMEAQSMPPTPHRRILVVDDDAIAGPMLARLLSEDYEVDLATNGVDGLRLATGDPGPDLIIADIGMPRLDGLSMAHLIRRQAKRKVPLIFLTGRDNAHDLIRGIQAGARHYITKPVNLAALERKIRRALGA